MSVRTDPTTPKASLLGLPWELREQIYQDYFKVDGGYVYDADSDKLVEASGQAVDMSLRYTCRSIADETRHFPFNLNAITFSTVYRRDWQKQAGALGYIVRYHTQLEADLLVHLRRLVTPDMYTQLGVKSPQYMPIIKDVITGAISWDERHPRHPYPAFDDSLDIQDGFLPPQHNCMRLRWRDNTISFKRAIAYILRLVAEKHASEFAEAIDEILPGWTQAHSPLELFDACFDPWAVPSLQEVAQVSKQLQMHKLWNGLENWYQNPESFPPYEGPTYRYRKKHRFSAAAIAIRFLNGMPQKERLLIRKLIVNEDRPATAHPECHPIGLIPFCQENEGLLVEQRVNLWRNLLLSSDLPSARHMVFLVESIHTPDPDWRGPHQMITNCLHGHFTTYVMHVLEVLKEGMPSGSYHILLDGDPDLNFASELFSTILQRSIAWLTLHTECVTRGVFTDRNHRDYPFRTSNVVDDDDSLRKGTSIFRCNFNLDQPWDYETMAERNFKHNDPSLDNWLSVGGYGDPDYFDVSTPTLNLVDLQLDLFERVERKEQEECEESKAQCPSPDASRQAPLSRRCNLRLYVNAMTDV